MTKRKILVDKGLITNKKILHGLTQGTKFLTKNLIELLDNMLLILKLL